MYAMIILTWLSGAGPVAATVNGFSSAKTCEAARQALIDHYAWWSPRLPERFTVVCVAQ